jgi:hypothetical protein
MTNFIKGITIHKKDLQEMYDYHTYNGRKLIRTNCVYNGKETICDIEVEIYEMPLGIKPRYIFEEEVKDLKRKRIDELGDAVQRYMKARIIPKTAWLDELEELRKEVE